MNKNRFSYDTTEQNKNIKRIIDKSAWSMDMLKEFVFDGVNLPKYLLSNKILDWRTIRDLSWALRCSPSVLTGNPVGIGYYSTQPVYPDVMICVSNNVPFWHLTEQEITDYAKIIGVPAYIIEYMRDSNEPLHCTWRFAKLFTKRFNAACPAGQNISVEYFFSIKDGEEYEKENSSNYTMSFIKSIEDSDLSSSDLMKLSRFCELEAEKRQLLNSVNVNL